MYYYLNPPKALQPSQHSKSSPYFLADQHLTSSSTSPSYRDFIIDGPLPAAGTTPRGATASARGASRPPPSRPVASPPIPPSTLPRPSPILRPPPDALVPESVPSRGDPCPFRMLTSISQGRTNPQPHKDAPPPSDRSRCFPAPCSRPFFPPRPLPCFSTLPSRRPFDLIISMLTCINFHLIAAKGPITPQVQTSAALESRRNYAARQQHVPSK